MSEEGMPHNSTVRTYYEKTAFPEHIRNPT